MSVSRGGVLAALVLAITSGLADRSLAQEIRPYRPAFDVQDYAIAIDVPDTGSTIHAAATITVARRAPADTLILDLLDLRVSRVKVDGRVARFTQGPESLAIALPKTKSALATFKVAVEYGGVLRDGLIVHRDDAGRWTYFGDNWPNRARHWIPSIDHPSDKATVT